MSDKKMATYPVLIVEDEEEQARRYKNAIKKACEGEIRVDIEIVGTGEQSIDLLQERLWPFVSLDQKIPMKPRGQLAEAHGVTVGQIARAYQPLQLLTVLTGYPGVESYKKLKWPGVEYLEKGKDVVSAAEYGGIFVKRLREFEVEGIWRTGMHVLPAPLAERCADYHRNKENDFLRCLTAWQHLVENGLQMFFLMCIALIEKLGRPVGPIIKDLNAPFWKTGSIARNVEAALEALEERLSATGRNTELREVQRFFRNSLFLKSAAICPQVRNDWAHSPKTQDKEYLRELVESNRSWFVNWTLSCGFWSLHPMAVDLRMVARGAKYGLSGRPLRDRGEPVESEFWDWDGKLVADEKQVYQVICDPEHVERALVVSLHPLIRFARGEQDRAIWVAHDPAKNEYRNLMSGKEAPLGDTDLVDWWSDVRNSSTEGCSPPARMNGPKVEKAPTREECSASDDTLIYETESQSWFVSSLPDTKEISKEEASRLGPEVDIVLITATPVELQAVRGLLQRWPRRQKVLRSYNGPETYFLGRFGAFRSVVTMCRMGATGESAASLATEQALRLWSPRAIIMVGIAFGKDAKSQQVADVLVASQVIPYENQRVGSEKIVFRAPIPPSNAKLLNRFRNAPRWEFARPDGKPCRLFEGPVLSGEKLVDNPEFKAKLFESYPEAIGGEMEGAGLCAASGRLETPWILVKAICDWADGEKGEKHQPLAAAAATSLVHHVLSQKTVLD